MGIFTTETPRHGEKHRARAKPSKRGGTEEAEVILGKFFVLLAWDAEENLPRRHREIARIAKIAKIAEI
jgi:hypothetical protein